MSCWQISSSVDASSCIGILELVATSISYISWPSVLECCVYFFLGNWEMFTHCIQPKGHLICDIYTGTGYQGPSRLEHVGAFFNTDGIQPFKSSRLSIWPVYLGLASLPPNIRMNRDNLVTLALWVGSKPPMHLLLKLLKQIMKRISSSGVHIRTPTGMKTVHLHPLFWCIRPSGQSTCIEHASV